MIPVLSLVYTSKTSATVARKVTCEKCNVPFEYNYTFVAEGEGKSYYFLSNASAKAEAEETAAKNLEKRIATHHGVCPCPTCGWTQAVMVKEALAKVSKWPLYLGIVFGLFGALFTFALISDASSGAEPKDAAPMSEKVGFLVILFLLFAALLAFHRFRRGRANPNANWTSARVPSGM